MTSLPRGRARGYRSQSYTGKVRRFFDRLPYTLNIRQNILTALRILGMDIVISNYKDHKSEVSIF